MPSVRAFRKKVFQCGLYEAQDVLREIDDVEIVCLQPRAHAAFQLRERWQRRLLYWDVSKKLVFANAGLERIQVKNEYELFVAVCQNYWDLLSLNAIDGWKDKCRTSVCWLDELWVADLPESRYWLHALSQFDHVFIGCEGTVEAVSQAIGRRCHWIGGGVDAVRFSPYPDPPTRVIDVYRIGRTSQQVHEGLVRAAASNELFYLHDTCRGSHMDTLDHREHRRLLANIAKRSRYFVVGPGKVDAPEETRGQIELGYRYYEGSAAGAVMIGHAADCRSFRERFDWRDAVIHVNGSDVVDVIADLNAQPDRLREIGRRNAAEALMRHDWLYRWMHIYDIAGVSPTRRMAERECHLKALARLANNDHRLRTIEVSGARRNRHVE